MSSELSVSSNTGVDGRKIHPVFRGNPEALLCFQGLDKGRRNARRLC